MAHHQVFSDIGLLVDQFFPLLLHRMIVCTHLLSCFPVQNLAIGHQNIFESQSAAQPASHVKIWATGVLLLKQDIADVSLVCRLHQNPSILYALS